MVVVIKADLKHCVKMSHEGEKFSRSVREYNLDILLRVWKEWDQGHLP